MTENDEKRWSLFPKATSSNVLFCPKSKDIQFIVIRGLKKPENIHIWEAEVREFGQFFLKKKMTQYN